MTPLFSSSTQTRPPSLVRPRVRQTLTVQVAEAVALTFGLLVGCAAELEDAQEFTDNVRPGLGASGVLPRGATPVQPDDSDSVEPDDTDSVQPQPSVQPQTSADVEPQPSVDPGSSAPMLSTECADVPTRIFQAKCDGDSCHGSPGNPALFFSDIASSTEPALLVDVDAKATCADKKLVDSSNPANSAVLSVVQAEGHCSGGRMPSGGPFLSDDEIRCLTEWVNAAASGQI